jgi:hypothetical protein
MELILGLLTLVPIALIALFFAFAEYLDWHGRIDLIKEKHHKLWRVMNDRPFRLVMLLMIFAALATDLRGNLSHLDSEPIVFRFVAPVPPNVEQAKAEPPEPPDSLRRRTTKIANELSLFWSRRPTPPQPVQNPNTEEDRKRNAVWDQYWREVESIYSREYKDRILGIIREYKVKGVPTGYLEAAAENRPFGASPFSMTGSPVCFQDELCQFRELAYHVDARDQLIGPDF